MTGRRGWVAVLLIAGLCLGVFAVSWAQMERVNVYRVEGLALDMGNVSELYEILGIQDPPLQRRGEMQFMDPRGYEWLPTFPLDQGGRNEDRMDETALGFDYNRIRQMKAVDPEDAVNLFELALFRSGLHPADVGGAMDYELLVDYSIFQAVNTEGGEIVTAKLDAHVQFDFFLDGHALVGPGAQVRASLHPEMGTTAFSYALRSVHADGTVGVIPVAEALDRYWKRIGEVAGDADFDVDLVYYAPPLEFLEAEWILPHYRVSGVALVDDEKIDLPISFIPAVVEEEGLIPVIEGIEVSRIDERTYQAMIFVYGGSGPYTVDAVTSVSVAEFVEVDENRDALVVTFGLLPGIANRYGGDEYSDTLTVGITDRNGIRVTASTGFEAVALAPQITLASAEVFSLLPGRVDAGVEYTGVCEGLPNTAANGAGFANVFRGRGIPVAFEWGGYNAWERDYVDSRKRSDGIDSDYIDNVDIAFHSSHGNSSGFTFCSSQQSTFMHYSRALWGDRDIEWLGIDACSVLAKSSGSTAWYNRWGPAFDGLHLLMSFEGVNYDTTVEGRRFAENLFGLYYYNPLPVRAAWTSMCIRTHGSNVRYAVMGVIGPVGLSNYNDYFWGQGPVGPDIRGSSIRGWWLLTGPC